MSLWVIIGPASITIAVFARNTWMRAFHRRCMARLVNYSAQALVKLKNTTLSKKAVDRQA